MIGSCWILLDPEINHFNKIHGPKEWIKFKKKGDVADGLGKNLPSLPTNDDVDCR